MTKDKTKRLAARLHYHGKLQTTEPATHSQWVLCGDNLYRYLWVSPGGNVNHVNRLPAFTNYSACTIYGILLDGTDLQAINDAGAAIDLNQFKTPEAWQNACYEVAQQLRNK